MIHSKEIQIQIRAVIAHFPKLSSRQSDDNKFWIVEGDLDICDNTGAYWDTFQIAIVLNDKYPWSIPMVVETAKNIPRTPNRHVSPEGVCCLDIDHTLLRMASRGVVLLNFMIEKVYPFFANQVFFEKHGRFAGEEYSHRFAGVLEYYRYELQLLDNETCILIISRILSKSLPERNDPCICGADKKYKKCHMRSVEVLKEVGLDQLQKDLDNFKSEQSKQIP